MAGKDEKGKQKPTRASFLKWQAEMRFGTIVRPAPIGRILLTKEQKIYNKKLVYCYYLKLLLQRQKLK